MLAPASSTHPDDPDGHLRSTLSLSRCEKCRNLPKNGESKPSFSLSKPRGSCFQLLFVPFCFLGTPLSLSHLLASEGGRLNSNQAKRKQDSQPNNASPTKKGPSNIKYHSIKKMNQEGKYKPLNDTGMGACGVYIWEYMAGQVKIDTIQKGQNLKLTNCKKIVEK